VRVATATSAAHPDRGNEDFIGAVPGAVVLVDGAGIRGVESLCRHGVAWYAHGLGGLLLSRLSRDTTTSLREVLAEAIEQVTSWHRDTCDVRDPSSPSATVAMVRCADGRVDHLVLGDSVVVVEHRAGPLVVEDRREPDLARPLRASMVGLEPGTPAHEAARQRAITAFRANRNRPGGFWVAKEDGAAAAEAVVGEYAAADVSAVVVLSNGASRVVDRFGLLDWRDLSTREPADIIAMVRDAEREAAVEPDDATLACTRFGA
jgi:hypothetical protein